MWYEYVTEDVIEKLSIKFPMMMNIDVSPHAQDRQATRIVSDKEIIDCCKKFMFNLIKDLLTDNLTMQNEFVLMDKSNDLNVVGQIRGLDVSKLTFRIITCMFKKNFKPSNNVNRTDKNGNPVITKVYIK